MFHIFTTITMKATLYILQSYMRAQGPNDHDLSTKVIYWTCAEADDMASS